MIFLPRIISPGGVCTAGLLRKIGSRNIKYEVPTLVPRYLLGAALLHAALACGCRVYARYCGDHYEMPHGISNLTIEHLEPDHAIWPLSESLPFIFPEWKRN